MNKHLKNSFCFLFLLLSGGAMSCLQGQSLPTTLPEHPRLLMTDNEMVEIKSAIESDENWAMVHRLMLEEAGRLLAIPVSERVMEGKRLLDVSRETLRRILLLGYASRITNEKKYAVRAIRELQAVAEFSDWNPSHFLDVAEMTTAVAIGYDWFYPALSSEEKELIRDAIIKKGIGPSLDSSYNAWLDRTNNWNQVCNTGISYGALAIYEDIPDLAGRLLRRAIESVRKPMQAYAPEGAYPEGYSYWGYGTTYNVLLIDALEKCIGNDAGLSKMPGFMRTPEFILHMIAPDRDAFNYGDNKDSGRFSPAMCWFARKNKDTSLLWNEAILLQKGNKKKLLDYRFFPLAIIWGAGIDLSKPKQPQAKVWVASRSTTPIALMRTSWEGDSGIYLAFKGGKANSSHAHMDIGSFILVADGERWAMDFGRQDYHSLESKGLDLWNREQDSDRWKVFRYNNLTHNTLSFDERLQCVDGHAPIESYADRDGFVYAISDLSAVYQGQVETARRGVAIVDQQYAVVRDEIKTGKKATTLRWTMLTAAQPEIKAKNQIELRIKDKTLLLEVESPSDVQVRTWTTEPPAEYDAQNPGTVRVGFEWKIPADTQCDLLVKLIPGSAEVDCFTGALNTWNTYKNK